MNTNKVDKTFRNITKSKFVHEGFLLIEDLSGEFSYSRGCGGREEDTPMLTASISKLFTTTCVLALIEQGKVRLEDKLVHYLNEEFINGLHVYKGQDYSNQLTIRHLLFQTSGLPDYYLDGGGGVFKKVIQGDFVYTFQDELDWVKTMKPPFAPGTKGKAYYSDVNFDLLGRVIEVANGSTLKEAYVHYIFEPLKLKHTYLVTDEKDFVPHTYYKDKRLERAQFIRSCQASGGCVTTIRELMLFIKAFWSGHFIRYVMEAAI